MEAQKFVDFFSLKKGESDLKTEILAGITTFLTMSYIIVVNPSILSKTGMNFAAILTATVIVSAITSILMGIYAKLPYAIAPGMGLNAFFTYTLVLGKGISWETALGAVFVSGIVFIILSLLNIRKMIVEAIPTNLQYAVAAGIGLFLALIGLNDVGFIVGGKGTVVSFGGFNIQTELFILCFALTMFLVSKKIKGALLLSIIINSIVVLIASIGLVKAGIIKSGIVTPPKTIISLPSFSLFFKMNVKEALTIGMIAPVFTFLFTDMFDSISTYLGLARSANLIDDKGIPINVNKALLTDALATTISGISGTSSGTVYIESSAGIQEGGKTGLTAVVAGLLFLPFMFLSPLLSFVPSVATAPVLVIVGVFMAKTLREIEWDNLTEAIPAFIAFILIPLTYSITQGIVWGFLTYTVLKILNGEFKKISITLYIIDIMSILALIAMY